MHLSVVILAAGLGRRMQSSFSKVLHKVGEKSLIQCILHEVQCLCPSQIIIVCLDHQQMNQCQKHLGYEAHAVTWVLQEKPFGTAHAVLSALNSMIGDHVMVVSGDCPFFSSYTLQKLMISCPKGGMSFLSADMRDLDMNCKGLARVIRDEDGRFSRIVEAKDATEQELQITEINAFPMMIEKSVLFDYLPRIQNFNAQKEYYLTDLHALLVRDKKQVIPVLIEQAREAMGVNDRAQHAQANRWHARFQLERLLEQGVMIEDIDSVTIRGHVMAWGSDIWIGRGVVLEGFVYLESHVHIEPYSTVRYSILRQAAYVKSYTMVDRSVLGEKTVVGPFAHIRPGTYLCPRVRLGNFVEVKASCIGSQSKVPHLSYMGDASLGSCVNVGAGSITCNYDGYEKHRTFIGHHVSIGADTQLIAPITIDDGATIGAGSTITDPVDGAGLTISRSKQMHIPSWKRQPKKPGHDRSNLIDLKT